VNDLTMTGFTTPDAARMQGLLKEIQGRGAHSASDPPQRIFNLMKFFGLDRDCPYN
jgi:hypothetical protein